MTTKEILAGIHDKLTDLAKAIVHQVTIPFYPERDKLTKLWSTFYCPHSGATFTVLSDDFLVKVACPDCKRQAHAVHWTIPKQCLTPETIKQLEKVRTATRPKKIKPESKGGNLALPSASN